jgi:DNA polymerase III subunit alpha
MDIKVLPPSINSSQYSFKAESSGVRYGLAGIKGIGAAVIKDILEARRKKPFLGIFDFCIRLPQKSSTRKILESLVHSGSFDEFGIDRASLLASLDAAIEHAQLLSPEEDGQTGLFTSEDFMPEPKYTEVDPIPIDEKLAKEKEVLGFYLSSHPLSLYEKALRDSGTIFLTEIVPGSGQLASGIYITSSKKIRTKKGDTMAFLTISDSSGEMEAVAFPDVYRKHSKLFNQGGMAVIEGKAESRDGKVQFIIRNAEEIGTWLEKHKMERLYLKLVAMNQGPERLAELKELLGASKGTTEVLLHYEGMNKTIRLGPDDRVTPTESLVKALSAFLGENNVILK